MDSAREHPLGPTLVGEVDDIVGWLRGPAPCRLDIELLAERVSVRLAWRDLGNALLGLTLAGGKVLLNGQRLSRRRGQTNYVFAHELAHVLRRRGHFASVAREDEEWFADLFARELVLPRRWLLGRRPADLAADLCASYEVVALQLAIIGQAPSLMRHEQRVLCRTCGTRPHRWGCECLPWRDPTRRDVDRLADVRRLDLFTLGGAHAYPGAEEQLTFVPREHSAPRHRSRPENRATSRSVPAPNQLELGQFAPHACC